MAFQQAHWAWSPPLWVTVVCILSWSSLSRVKVGTTSRKLDVDGRTWNKPLLCDATWGSVFRCQKTSQTCQEHHWVNTCSEKPHQLGKVSTWMHDRDLSTDSVCWSTRFSRVATAYTTYSHGFPVHFLSSTCTVVTPPGRKVSPASVLERITIGIIRKWPYCYWYRCIGGLQWFKPVFISVAAVTPLTSGQSKMESVWSAPAVHIC